MTTFETSPFELDGSQLANTILPHLFPQILRRLLSVEAQSNDLPQDGIHVADNITAADGGEDGRIEWKDGPDRTEFLPGRLCQFQLKTGDITPAAAGRDVVDRCGQVKPMVRSVLQRGGHYILLCTHAYTQQAIEKRTSEIYTALHAAGMEVNKDRIWVRDAAQLAHWINHYPSVAIWVNEQAGHTTVRPFRSWDEWRQRTEHQTSPWIKDDRLPVLQEHLRQALAQPHQFIRIVGISGVGKSRLVLEALAPSSETDSRPVADLVMYADLSESAPNEINRVVQSLVDNRQRAVAVVDNCPPRGHRILVNITHQRASCVTLLTVDHEIPSGMDGDLLIKKEGDGGKIVKVPEAPSSVVEGIIVAGRPDLPSEDSRRLVLWSRGNPKVARRVLQAWTDPSQPIAYATDEDIAEAFVAGHWEDERDLLLKAARLLAAFRLVALDSDQDNRPDDLDKVASVGRDLTAADLRSVFERMIDRGAARRRGRFVTIEPRAIAIRLAERQWREWPETEHRKILGGESIGPVLKASAAKQLALLNDTELARKIVGSICCPGGPFDGRDGLLKPGHAEVLHSLAQVDPSLAGDQIRRSLDDIADLHDIRDSVRRDLVRALEKIAFDAESFDVGARLLLRLAVAENEDWANNATGQFKALFPVVLGNTAAEGEARIDLMRDILQQSYNPAQQQILVETLIKASTTHRFSRSVGAETHGARPALKSWRPATERIVRTYLEYCVNMLANFASGTEAVADIARKGLGGRLRGLALYGFIDLVENAVETVVSHCGIWPDALEALRRFLALDVRRMPEGDERRNTETRVRSLIVRLRPQSLAARVRTIVTAMPRYYLVEDNQDADIDFQQLRQRQDDAVRELVVEMLQCPGAIEEHLAEICGFSPNAERNRRMTCAFGRALAEAADTPLDWLEPIVAALHDTPLEQRDFGMLAGYLAGLPAKHAATIAAFKQRCADDSTLAPAFPRICACLTVTASDIDLALSFLQAGMLQPSHLTWWSGGNALTSIGPEALIPLFDALLDHSADGYCHAVELMAMYAPQRAPEKVLDKLVPQLRKVAEDLAEWPPGRCPSPTMGAHFEKLMMWLLDKGRDDPDAQAAAMALSSALTGDQKDGCEGIAEPLIRPLLETFPEISWPIIGAAILSKPLAASRLEVLLGERLWMERNNPPILRLPEAVLFDWCRANTDDAAAFTAKTLPFLESHDSGKDAALHPRMGRLIDEFGDRPRVQKALTSNIFSDATSSLYRQYNPVLSSLRDGQSSSSVKRWARETVQTLADTIEQSDRTDDEWHAQNED